MFTTSSIFNLTATTFGTTATATSSITTGGGAAAAMHFVLCILRITLCQFADMSDCHYCRKKGVCVIFIHTSVNSFIWTSLVLGSARARTACLSQVEEVLETDSA
jgi:FtsH-binding integral membrane protein